MDTVLPAFAKFDVASGPTNLGNKWDKYISRFDNLLIAMNVTDDKRERTLLLHYAGNQVQDIFETLKITKRLHMTKLLNILQSIFSQRGICPMQFLIFTKLLRKKERLLINSQHASGNFHCIVNSPILVVKSRAKLSWEPIARNYGGMLSETQTRNWKIYYCMDAHLNNLRFMLRTLNTEPSLKPVNQLYKEFSPAGNKDERKHFFCLDG